MFCRTSSSRRVSALDNHLLHRFLLKAEGWGKGGTLSVLRVLIILLRAPTYFGAQDAPTGFAERITIVESDRLTPVDQSQITRLFWQLIREEQLEVKAPPRILVIHLSDKAALRFGRLVEAVRVDHCEKISGSAYYQLWIVGKPTVQAYVDGLYRVLAREFGLQISELKLRDVLQRVTMQ